jgi:oxygen-dependent protoporphyrinogen oxidase
VRAVAPGWTVDGAAFDAVVLALPAAQAAELARGFDPALAEALGAFTAGSSATLSLVYGERAFAHALDGAGFVVPRAEGAALGGIIGGSFTHRKFERRGPAGAAIVRLFFAGAEAELDETALAARGHAALERLLGAHEPPRERHVARWPGGMPRYRVGHRERVAAAFAAAARHPGLALAGNSYTGVGIPDCIKSGEDAALRLNS